ENDLVLDDPLVSRWHAWIERAGGEWVIADRGSANGILVNRVPVQRAVLRPGDTALLGGSHLQLRAPGAAPAAPHGGGRLAHTTQEQRLGPYVILSMLGEGGMSRVLLARDERAGRLVALKLLRRHSAYLAEKFRQEGMLRLRHPAIAQVLETGRHEGQSYIAIEYIAGASLRRLLAGGPLPISQALGYAAQILGALDYAHRAGIVHRDLKPENIIVAPERGAVLIDFGIARDLGAATVGIQMLVGTPQYMSYEQVVGLPVDQTSDLYALGIVLYELLTGRVPFDGDEPVAVLLQHQQRDPLPPRRLRPEIPAYVEAAIMRALAKDRSARFADAAAFAEALGYPALARERARRDSGLLVMTRGGS
ncbi:MAG: protein kinase, partial [Chloroflexales bacterium]|nr:protein kinase [Chloroflexales bacterium]